jgi:hypothetical protein
MAGSLAHICPSIYVLSRYVQYGNENPVMGILISVPFCQSGYLTIGLNRLGVIRLPTRAGHNGIKRMASAKGGTHDK